MLSCSSRNIRPPSLSQNLLFPLGTYQHKVNITTSPTPEHKSQNFSFTGVVQISLERIQVVGLSPFGATLFKLTEERSSEKLMFDSFIDAFKGHEAKFQEYYPALKHLLTAPHNFSSTSKSMPNTHFTIKSYDKNGIPERIEIQDSKFSIDIRVTGYDI